MTHPMHALCPVCQRYSEPGKTCPYCDALRPLPWIHRKLRRGTWMIATVGLLLLMLGTRMRPPQTLPIAEITPTMQFAQLYFEGNITHIPRISRNRRSAATDLDDESGATLRIVFLEGALTRLKEQMPDIEAGSRLYVSGSLRIRADEPPVLFIRSPEQFDFPE